MAPWRGRPGASRRRPARESHVAPLETRLSCGRRISISTPAASDTSWTMGISVACARTDRQCGGAAQRWRATASGLTRLSPALTRVPGGDLSVRLPMVWGLTHGARHLLVAVCSIRIVGRASRVSSCPLLRVRLDDAERGAHRDGQGERLNGSRAARYWISKDDRGGQFGKERRRGYSPFAPTSHPPVACTSPAPFRSGRTA